MYEDISKIDVNAVQRGIKVIIIRKMQDQPNQWKNVLLWTKLLVRSKLKVYD